MVGELELLLLLVLPPVRNDQSEDILRVRVCACVGTWVSVQKQAALPERADLRNVMWRRNVVTGGDDRSSPGHNGDQGHT